MKLFPQLATCFTTIVVRDEWWVELFFNLDQKYDFKVWSATVNSTVWHTLCSVAVIVLHLGGCGLWHGHKDSSCDLLYGKSIG